MYIHYILCVYYCIYTHSTEKSKCGTSDSISRPLQDQDPKPTKTRSEYRHFHSTFSSSCNKALPMKKKTKNINVSDRCGVLHQPLWWYTRLGSRHRDPVLQFISICSHNGPTVGHVVTMEDENTDRLLKLQFEQFVGW